LDYIAIDGQVAINIDEQDLVTINDSRVKRIMLIKNPDRFYFETIRDKFVLSKKE
jgi:NAD kinase